MYPVQCTGCCVTKLILAMTLSTCSGLCMYPVQCTGCCVNKLILAMTLPTCSGLCMYRVQCTGCCVFKLISSNDLHLPALGCVCTQYIVLDAVSPNLFLAMTLTYLLLAVYVPCTNSVLDVVSQNLFLAMTFIYLL